MDFDGTGGPDDCSGGNLRLFLVNRRFSTDHFYYKRSHDA